MGGLRWVAAGIAVAEAGVGILDTALGIAHKETEKRLDIELFEGIMFWKEGKAKEKSKRRLRCEKEKDVI